MDDTPELSSEQKLRRFSTWIVDAPSNIVFERKLRRFSAWIIEALPDVVFEWTSCVEKILLSLFYVPAEVTNILCVDSRHHAKHNVRTEVAKVLCVNSRRHARRSIRMEVAIVLGVKSRGPAGGCVPMELLCGKENTFSFQRSDRTNRLTLHV